MRGGGGGELNLEGEGTQDAPTSVWKPGYYTRHVPYILRIDGIVPLALRGQ